MSIPASWRMRLTDAISEKPFTPTAARRPAAAVPGPTRAPASSAACDFHPAATTYISCRYASFLATTPLACPPFTRTCCPSANAMQGILPLFPIWNNGSMGTRSIPLVGTARAITVEPYDPVTTVLLPFSTSVHRYLTALEIRRILCISNSLVLRMFRISAQRPAPPWKCLPGRHYRVRRRSLFHPVHQRPQHVEIIQRRAPPPQWLIPGTR